MTKYMSTSVQCIIIPVEAVREPSHTCEHMPPLVSWQVYMAGGYIITLVEVCYYTTMVATAHTKEL